MSESSARKGNVGTFAGMKHSEEAKQKMSIAAKLNPTRKLNASKGGKRTAENRIADPIEFEEYKKRQSEKMKQIWASRKQKGISIGE